MSELSKAGMGMPIDEKAIISFSDDKTEAYIFFSEPRFGGASLTPEKIKSDLADCKIKYGLDNNVIEDLAGGNRSYNKNFVVAVGKKAVNGKDSGIEYMFNTGIKSLTPKLNEDGTVDYRNLDLIEMVEAGSVLVRLTLPTEGEAGIDVFGDEIQPVAGKISAKIPRGKNTVVSADGLELIAETSGQIVMVKGVVSIAETLEINGDVGNSTGNVDFNGSVIVYGNVLAGFRVTAIGNIEVKGSIEGAEIECMGNLIAGKDILGMHKANIKVGGSVYARMIQDATGEVGGDIASDGIMHCNLKCGGRIELKGKKGVLVGGNISCKKEIEAFVFGSPLGTHTEINVGLDAGVYERYKMLINEIGELKKQYEDMAKDLKVMSKVENMSTLPTFKKNSYIKSLYDAQSIQEELKEKQEEALELKNELDISKYSGRVISHSVVHPGVNIQIGNAVAAIRDQLGICSFYNDEGRVKIRYDV